MECNITSGFDDGKSADIWGHLCLRAGEVSIGKIPFANLTNGVVGFEFGFFFLDARVDDTIGLHCWEGNIGDPEAYKDAGCNSLDSLGTTKLATNCWVSPGQQNDDGSQSFSTEDGDRETKTVEIKSFISILHIMI